MKKNGHVFRSGLGRFLAVLTIGYYVFANGLAPLYGLAYAQLTAEQLLAIAAAVILMRLFKKLEKRGEAA